MGTLTVEACVLGMVICTPLFSRSGQQHAYTSPWTLARVVLPPNTEFVRWTGTDGGSFRGDMAVDTISIDDTSIPPVAQPTSAPTSSPTAPTASPTNAPTPAPIQQPVHRNSCFSPLPFMGTLHSISGISVGATSISDGGNDM